MLYEGISFLVHLPYAEAFSRGCENIFLVAFKVWDPHHFGWREIVLEFIDFLESILWLF